MQLRKFTDYSIRLLIHLAVKPSEWINIATVAETFDISRNHLLKVVTELSQQGLIQTQRGKHGGVRLAVAPEKINIGDLLERLEGDGPVVECMQPLCPIMPACVLRSALDEAQTAFFKALRRYTLADLVHGKESQLRRLIAAS